MRVLHVANFSWFPGARGGTGGRARHYSTDRKISNGLARNGHCVWDFSYRDVARHLSPLAKSKRLGAQAMQRDLLACAKEFAPDVILLGHSELLSADALRNLRRETSAAVAQWWVDPFESRSLPHLREKMPLLDAFCATTAPAYFVPLLGGDTPSHYLPNVVDGTVETGRAFEPDARHEHDVFFAGNDTAVRAAALAQVDAMPGVRRGFFGFGGRPHLHGARYQSEIAASKIGLNLSQASDIPLYSSDRLAHIAGNGACVVTPRTPLMENLFAEDEVCYFAEEEEIPGLVRGLLDDDSRRRTIARSGWERAHAAYNEKRIARFLLEAAGGGEFSEPYEWLPFSLNTRRQEGGKQSV